MKEELFLAGKVTMLLRGDETKCLNSVTILLPRQINNYDTVKTDLDS